MGCGISKSTVISEESLDKESNSKKPPLKSVRHKPADIINSSVTPSDLIFTPPVSASASSTLDSNPNKSPSDNNLSQDPQFNMPVSTNSGAKLVKSDSKSSKSSTGSSKSSKSSTVIVPDDKVTSILLNSEPKEVNFKPIHSAIRWNNKSEEEMRALISSVEAANCYDPSNGNRPIHIAAQNGHLDLVKLLIELKADVTLGNLKGNTALHMAVSYDYYDVAMTLVAAGADLEAVNEADSKARYGLENDKTIGMIKFACATTRDVVIESLDMINDEIEHVNKVTMAQLGFKVKKVLGPDWTPDIQDKFKELITKLN